MVIGICRITLAMREARSLKSKRQILKSLKDKMKKRFNVSIAEVEGQDYHQNAVIGIAVVSSSSAHADSQLQSAINFVSMEAEVVDVSTRLVTI
ncbi:MAG: DUF503 domain-containing protein [Nitrospinota bacterium]|nr:DUF503 domain-containing protein [Nitrospinota bacterium]